MDLWATGIEEPLLRFFRNPADVPAVDAIFKCFTRDKNAQESAAYTILKNQSFKELYESWYVPEEFTLAELQELPEGTLGRAYSDHMIKNGLDPNFISELETRDVLSYVWCRATHVHDIGHLMTGYNTTYLGELALKAFDIGQHGSPFSTAMLGAGMFSVMAYYPVAARPMMDAIVAGYERGKQFPLLMGIKWDLEWETPMDEVRSKYGIPAV
jgi:ubiquinone biosynthesis protein Coq4